MNNIPGIDFETLRNNEIRLMKVKLMDTEVALQNGDYKFALKSLRRLEITVASVISILEINEK